MTSRLIQKYMKVTGRKPLFIGVFFCFLDKLHECDDFLVLNLKLQLSYTVIRNPPDSVHGTGGENMVLI